MSTNADTAAKEAGGLTDHETVKSALATAREELTYKLENGRVRDVENEKVRIKQARALAYVCNVELRAIEADTLEELTEDVEQLKEDRDLS